MSVDDAMLTLNVASRSFAGLLHPLALEQTAPIGFLWALKALTVLFGVSDPVLRMIPVIAGIALPYVMWRVARRVVGEPAALLAAFFAACSPILIAYSVSAKPYETDALVTLLLSGLTLDVLDARSPAAWWRLTLGGAVALLLSTPAVFILAGSALALVITPAAGRAPGRFVAAAVTWMAVFAATYLSVTRVAAASPYMQAFWREKFLIVGGRLDPVHIWDVLRRLPVQPFVPDKPLDGPLVVLWVAFGWGAWRLARVAPGRAALVAGGIGALLGAATVHRYPIAPRVCVFAAPLFFLLFVSAVEDALGRWPWRRPIGLAPLLVRAVVGLWILTLPILAANTRFWSPDTRTLARELERRHRRAEPVYVFTGAVPAWTVYTTDWSAPDTLRLERIFASQAATGEAFHNAASRNRAVSDTQGAQLGSEYQGHWELLGLSPGMQWREGSGYEHDRPDSGWGEREATRIRAVSDSTAWVVLAHLYPGEKRVLLGALQGQGARADFVLRAHRGAMLYRLRLPPR